jgi:hypothetical protein
MGKLITSNEAKPSKRQHTKPCSDCPFARSSLKRWLGGASADEWIAALHGENKIICHTVGNQQCAGAAIYRSNVCKLLRDKECLRLPADREKVFSSPNQFKEHHED